MTQSVGLVGTGRMGTAIGLRLLETGHSLTVWNRTTANAAPLVERGARQVDRPAAVSQACDVTLVLLRDDTALRETYAGPDGLTGGSTRGRAVVDMSTATIEAIKAAGRAVLEAGGAFVDAPVSGTIAPARSGALAIMAGGAADHVALVRPVLEQLSRKLTHVGPLGAGIAMKLVLNLPLATYWETLGEALALGRSQGLDFEMMLSLIADSKAAIGTLASKIDKILDPQAAVEFDLAGLRKDLDCMVRSAAAAGLALPACDAAKSRAEDAVRAGWGNRDLAQLVRFVAGGDA